MSTLQPATLRRGWNELIKPGVWVVMPFFERKVSLHGGFVWGYGLVIEQPTAGQYALDSFKRPMVLTCYGQITHVPSNMIWLETT